MQLQFLTVSVRLHAVRGGREQLGEISDQVRAHSTALTLHQKESDHWNFF